MTERKCSQNVFPPRSYVVAKVVVLSHKGTAETSRRTDESCFTTDCFSAQIPAQILSLEGGRVDSCRDMTDVKLLGDPSGSIL